MRKIYPLLFATLSGLLFLVAFLIGCTGGSGSGGGSSSGCSSNQVDCIDFCCPSGNNCCFNAQKCCPVGYPHYCASSNRCYKYFTGAQADCGNAYEVCGTRANLQEVPFGGGDLFQESLPALPKKCR